MRARITLDNPMAHVQASLRHFLPRSTDMRILSILALLLFPSLAFCQENQSQPETTVYVPFACRAGETYDYRVTETKYKAGQVKSAGTKNLELKILSVNDEKIVAAMNLVTQLDEAQLKKVEADPVAKSMKEMWESLVFEVVLTRDGVFSEFQNVEEIEAAVAKNREMILNIVDEMKPALIKMGKDPAEVDRMIAMVIKERGSTQAATGQILQPLNLILRFVDTELETGEPQVDQTEVDMGVVSGLPATQTHRVVEVDRKSNLAVIQYQVRIEGQEAATKFQKGIDAYVQKINPNHKPKTSFAKATIVSDSLIEGRMDLNSGWPESVTLTSKMNNLRDDQLLLERKVEVQRIKAKK